MKKTVLILFVLTGTLAGLFSSDPKDFVGGLFCLPSNETAENMILIADKYEDAGYEKTADEFRGFSDGWYGSGFLVKNRQGNILLISNKHVLGVSSKVKYRFETSADAVVEFEGEYPVFQDPYLDLALVDIPDEEVKDLSSISLMKRAFSDGDDIFSAGYPMLLGEPGWQLSKGVISNKSASVDGIISSEYTKLIQHSASIDGGNSGGPLLVKVGSDWVPVGVNTWSVTSRNDTFFAIPTDNVINLIDEYQKSLDKRQDYANEKHKGAVDRFLLLMADEEWDTTRAHWDISMDLTNEKGWNAFQALLEEPEEVREEVGKRFGGQSYFQVMRESTLWWIWKNLKVQRLGDALTLKDYGSVPSSLHEGDKVVSTLETGGNPLELTMEYSRGDWYIADMEFIYPITKQYDLKKEKKEDSKKQNDDMTASAGFSIFGAPAFLNTSIPGSTSLLTSWGLGGFFYFDSNKYFSHGMNLYFLSLERGGEYFNYTTMQNETQPLTSGGIYFDYGLNLGYPVDMDDSVITPFIDAAIGAGGGFESAPEDSSFGSSSSDIIMSFYARYGIGVKYLIKEKSMGASLALNKRSGSIMGFDDSKLDSMELRIDIFWALDVFYY